MEWNNRPFVILSLEAKNWRPQTIGILLDVVLLALPDRTTFIKYQKFEVFIIFISWPLTMFLCRFFYF